MKKAQRFFLWSPVRSRSYLDEIPRPKTSCRLFQERPSSKHGPSHKHKTLALASRPSKRETKSGKPRPPGYVRFPEAVCGRARWERMTFGSRVLRQKEDGPLPTCWLAVFAVFDTPSPDPVVAFPLLSCCLLLVSLLLRPRLDEINVLASSLTIGPKDPEAWRGSP